MTPGLPCIPTPHSTVLSVSPHRNHQKTVIKDLDWEWAESGLLRGELIYLYFVSAGLNTHCSSTRSHFTQTPSLTVFPSLKNIVFLTPLIDFRCSSISLGGIVRSLAPHVLKSERKQRNTKIKIPCKGFQLWPSVSSEPDNQTARHAAASSQGIVSQNNCKYNP